MRLKAAALNHLDVFLSRGLPKRDVPAVTGADGAGVIDAVGEGVPENRLGEEVVIYPVVACGECDACRAGQEVHCPKFGIRGEHVDGTLQEALVVRSSYCHPRPEHLSWEQAAAMPLTWLTAWRLLFTRGRLQAGDTVVVVGIGGGVATAALLLARAHGMRIFVTSRDEAKRQRAIKMGAEAAFPSEGFGRAVQEATGKVGAKAVVDSVGPATLEESFRALGREGVVLMVGATSGPKAEVLLPRLWFRHLSLVTSTMGNHSEFTAMLEAVNRQQLVPPVDQVFSLEEGRAAFERLEAGEQFGKVVLVP